MFNGRLWLVDDILISIWSLLTIHLSLFGTQIESMFGNALPTNCCSGGELVCVLSPGRLAHWPFPHMNVCCWMPMSGKKYRFWPFIFLLFHFSLQRRFNKKSFELYYMVFVMTKCDYFLIKHQLSSWTQTHTHRHWQTHAYIYRTFGVLQFALDMPNTIVMSSNARNAELMCTTNNLKIKLDGLTWHAIARSNETNQWIICHLRWLSFG